MKLNTNKTFYSISARSRSLEKGGEGSSRPLEKGGAVSKTKNKEGAQAPPLDPPLSII